MMSLGGKGFHGRARGLVFLFGALTLTAAPAVAQTTYIGGSGPSGTSVIGAGEAVTVNLDAIGGTRPARARNGGNGAASGKAAGFGQPIEGPGGAVLLYPPKSPPHSHLLVDTPESVAKPKLTPPTEEPTIANSQPAEPSATVAPSPQKPAAPTKTADAQPATVAPTAPRKPTAPPKNVAATQTESGAEPAKPAHKPAVKAASAAPERAAEKADEQQVAAAAQPAEEPAAPPPPPKAPSAPDRSDATPPDSGTDVQAAETSEPAPAPSSKPAQPEETTVAADTADENPTPEPAAESASEPTRTQVASLPPASEGLPKQIRLVFPNKTAELSGTAKDTLAALADRLKAEPQQRIQLVAYAEASEDRESRARRLSLSRALAVRSYLIDQGVRSTRMDVRALGSTAESGPLNRLDIKPARR